MVDPPWILSWTSSKKWTTKTEKNIRFKQGATYGGHRNYAASGDCGLAAYTTVSQLITGDQTYCAGFYAATVMPDV